MKEGSEVKKALDRLAAAMKKNKRTELIVYGVLILAGVLLLISVFTAEGGFMGLSVSGQDKGDTTDVERRLSEVLSGINGAGSVDVMVVQDEAGLARGVIVIAEGAADASVRVMLKRAVQTVLAIDSGTVEVFERQPEN